MCTTCGQQLSCLKRFLVLFINTLRCMMNIFILWLETSEGDNYEWP